VTDATQQVRDRYLERIALYKSVGYGRPAAARWVVDQVKLVGYTTCGGCPGGNIEYAPEEMKKNGVEVIHLATGRRVGDPPCPHIEAFRRVIPEKYGMRVVVGTHRIPQKYLPTHDHCGTWKAAEWKPLVQATLAHEATRLAYD
jgi:predicted metal-binding protein